MNADVPTVTTIAPRVTAVVKIDEKNARIRNLCCLKGWAPQGAQ